MASAVHRRVPAMTGRIVTTSSVERVARLLYDDALRIVRSLVGRDHELGAEDICDIAWTVALWVAIDLAETEVDPVTEVSALNGDMLEKRARAEIRDFRSFRVPRVRLASGAGSVRVRVAIAECDVDSLADLRVSLPSGLAQLLAQLEAGLSASQKAVLPHNRSREAALTPAERKRLERVMQRLREQAPRCLRLASEVADYFDNL
ncbi:MAG: hypothetical protein ACYC3F_09695 [Gemmatimonadaceae bacterium]